MAFNPLKQISILLLFLCASMGSIKAQDYIYMLDGTVIEAEVRSLTGKYVNYVPFGEQVDEALKVAKADINRIRMKNGTETFYNLLPGQEIEEKKEEVVEEKPKKQLLKPAMSAQRMQGRNLDILRPMYIHTFAGVVLPLADASDFDLGYHLGAEFNNYFSNYFGVVGHLSGAYNAIDAEVNGKTVEGNMINTLFMAGGKVGTGVLLEPVRIYGQATIGGNYLIPSGDLSNEEEASFNLAYGGGIGVVIYDFFDVGARYHLINQDLSFTEGDHTYLNIYIGVHF